MKSMTSAGIWIDSTYIKLTENPTHTICTGVFVSGEDIYVCGSTYGANTYVQCWKNGNLMPFERTDYNGLPQYVTVSGNDVYVCGQVKEESDKAVLAAYWKNGKLIKLEDTKASFAGSIQVVGNNVYVAGWARFPRASAVIWVNGIPTRLNSEDYYSYASGVSVVGNDVYVSGWSVDSSGTTGKALYWKNGVQYTLTPPGVNGAATDVFIDGNDIYFSGDMYTPDSLYTPVYWKNGIVTTLGDYNTHNAASSIFVKNEDVYVAGKYGNKENYKAVYWKNGNKVELPADPASYAQSIFVK
ncbi:MAG: hypothetical protein KF746_19425 [Chitinophagaceae bacterium]|nr:hypothetical protein [Chitinophagaceae bacterium]